jgi:gamma-glutamyltranspeptidase/glutathione hydrolase
MRLPDYARTLERIARGGWREFHHGALGDEIAADLQANGAYVTRADIAGFEPELCAPLEGSYRGYTVRSNPPPGSGATLIQMLQILEHFELGKLDHSSARHLDLVARAMAAAHVDRNEYLGDPRFADVPTAMLIGKERAAWWAGKIGRGEFPGDHGQAPPSCTTHLCAMDHHGNAVTLTHTLGTASGVVTPGLGFNYNNSMKLFDPIPGRKNSMAPGKARTTGMVPTMLLKDGKPVLLAGAPGGSVIISDAAGDPERDRLRHVAGGSRDRSAHPLRRQGYPRRGDGAGHGGRGAAENGPRGRAQPAQLRAHDVARARDLDARRKDAWRLRSARRRRRRLRVVAMSPRG